MRRATLTLAVVALLLCGTAPAGAGIITINSFTSGTTTGNTSNPGEAITIPAGGPNYDNLQFNWYTNNPPTPEAFGTLFILDVGTHFNLNSNNLDSGVSTTNLSPSSPGFVAEALASGNEYTFAPGVTLLAGHTYEFFATGTPPSPFGDTAGLVETFDTLRFRAVSSPPGEFESQTGSTYDFRLVGTAVPEPTSLAVFGLAALAGVWYRRRRRPTVSA